jgi:uncharacterized protein
MFSQPYMRGIIALLGIAAIIGLLAYTYNAVTQARYQHTGPVIITVQGEGEVFAKPDIATFSFSVHAEGGDASSAQEKSAEAVNAIVAYVADEGIEEKDIKTLYYNLNPRYEYLQSICNTRGFCPPGERVLRGYEVSQTVMIKVRETDRAGELISGVGTLGATDISGLTFTIDDENALTEEARVLAIQDAEEKAVKLARDLNVRIVRMTGYWEDQGGYPISYYGMGGAERSMAVDEAAVSPNIPTGENTVVSRVSISYEVR